MGKYPHLWAGFHKRSGLNGTSWYYAEFREAALDF